MTIHSDAAVAQRGRADPIIMGAQLAVNQLVVGSSPTGGALIMLGLTIKVVIGLFTQTIIFCRVSRTKNQSLRLPNQ